MSFSDTKIRVGNLDITYGELDDAAHALVHRPGVDKVTLGVAVGCMEVITKLRLLEEARAKLLDNPPPDGWYRFGTHAGWDTSPPLEFSEETGEDGLPLFERRRDGGLSELRSRLHQQRKADDE